MELERASYQDLLANREKAAKGGGDEKKKEQHDKGKLTARERLNLLFDAGSFIETDAFVIHECSDFGMEQKHVFGDGVITGWGTVEGRIVYAYAQDFTTFGGSLSQTVAKKICKIVNLAIQNSAPVVGLNDSGGARIHEGVASLAGYADFFYLNVQASGVIPQISLILGPCAGGAVYSPAMTDFIFMVDNTSHMFITGPSVVKAVTGEEVSFEELGGARTHATKSGVIDRRFHSEEDAILGVKKLLTYIPSNNTDAPPRGPDPDKDPMIRQEIQENTLRLDRLVPENSNEAYDVRDLIQALVDPGSFWEIKPEYAKNIVTGLAFLGGYSVGIVANNPHYMAGAIDINASVKAARFVRFCDCFNIPIITLVDVPGFYPGRDQEESGIIRHGAKILYAFCEATVPCLTVITRKAYGGAYIVMGSKHIGGDLNLAWPSAEIAVMGAAAACQIIFKKEIDAAEDSQAEEKRQTDQYAKKFATPYVAAAKGYIDAVVFPSETRRYLLEGLKSLQKKQISKPKRKHGNIPL